MRPLREILTSQSFKREVSLLLFFFAALSALFTLIIFVSATLESEAFATGITTVIQTILYAVLAIMIRHGSNKALLAAGILFGLDILFFLASPPDRGVAGFILSRGLLIAVLVRYVRRERAKSA